MCGTAKNGEPPKKDNASVKPPPAPLHDIEDDDIEDDDVEDGDIATPKQDRGDDDDLPL